MLVVHVIVQNTSKDRKSAGTLKSGMHTLFPMDYQWLVLEKIMLESITNIGACLTVFFVMLMHEDFVMNKQKI